MSFSRFNFLKNELANLHVYSFIGAVKHILMHFDLTYVQAVAYLENLLAKGNDSYELKQWHIEHFKCYPIHELIHEEYMSDMTEVFQIEGTFQNFHDGARYRAEAEYLLVNYFRFTEDEAINVYEKIQEIDHTTSFALHALKKFIKHDLFALLSKIDVVMQEGVIGAEQAYLMVMQNMIEQDTQRLALTKLLISPAMFKRLNETCFTSKGVQVVKDEINAARQIRKQQMLNRASRCDIAKTCSGQLKLDAYHEGLILSIIDSKYMASPDEQQKFEALESSIAIDQKSCYQRPAYQFNRGYFSAFKSPHHLGFFSREAIAQPENTSSTPFSFKSAFGSMLRTLIRNCSSEQFLSLAALGLLTPVVHNTLATLTGLEQGALTASEGSEMMRLGM